MRKYFLIALLGSAIICDIIASFLQYYNCPSFDGDMPVCIVPAKVFETVLNHPLGFPAAFNHAIYANPNRFFSQWSIKAYYDHVPLLLQRFVNPVNSIYLASAILKLIIQIAITVLLSLALQWRKPFSWSAFFLGYILLSVFFQAQGYRGNMAIIDPSPSYNFFYALPIFFLLLYFYPIFKGIDAKKAPGTNLYLILWMLIGVVACLSGPIIPGVAIIIVGLIIVSRFLSEIKTLKRFKDIKKFFTGFLKFSLTEAFLLIFILLLASYSLFLGTRNLANESRSISEVYIKLGIGLKNQLTSSFGYPAIILTILVNLLFLKFITRKNEETARILRIGKWIAMFIFVYIILLPFGGYRSYRPYIVRYDTLIPVTLSLMYFLSLSTLYLLLQAETKIRNLILIIILPVVSLFVVADWPKLGENRDERESLKQLSTAIGNQTAIDHGYVLQWDKFNTTESSEINSELLYRWRITPRKILYYNK